MIVSRSSITLRVAKTTELSKSIELFQHMWGLRRSSIQYKINWDKSTRAHPYNG